MRLIRIIGVAWLMTAPAFAGAQQVHGSRGGHGTAGASGRVAGIAPAPTAVVANPVISPGTFLSGTVPVLVSPDGRVFADFGRGFEQIVTVCGARQGAVMTNVQTNVVVQPTIVQPTIAQPGIVVGPLPYTPAVPNQQTASQQMIAGAGTPVQPRQQFVVGNGMCWSSNDRGQVFVGRQ